ncbi:hypothetical protein ACLKA7_001558 [Drosophila subpalustris]
MSAVIGSATYVDWPQREIASWEEIAKALDLPKDEVSNKWNLLRQQFRNAHSKIQSTKSGQAAANRKPPNKFYSALHFMQPILSVDSGSRTSSYIGTIRCETRDTHDDETQRQHYSSNI